MEGKLKELTNKYAEFIYRNVEFINTLESSISNILPFFVVRYDRTNIVQPEIYYASLHAFTEIHDFLFIRKCRDYLQPENLLVDPTKEVVMPEWWEKTSLILSLVSSCEILVECAAMMKRKRWFAIFCIEFIKALLRLYMLVKGRGAILIKKKKIIRSHPTTPDPDGVIEQKTARRTLVPLIGNNINNTSWTSLWENQKIHNNNPNQTLVKKYIPSVPSLKSTFAELLFIFRPLIYVMMIITYGKNRWRPWIVSLIIELYSFYLFTKNKKLNAEEKDEKNRRLVQMLYYLARSPCFETVFCPMVDNFPIPSFLTKLPYLPKIIAQTRDYLCRAQQIYFNTAAS